MEKHVSHIILPYLEGNLDTESIEGVERHLSQCSACKIELEQNQLLQIKFESEELIHPSSKLRVRFMEALETEKAQVEETQELEGRIKSFSWSNPFLKVVAVVLLMIGAYWIGSNSRNDIPEQVVDTNSTENVSDNNYALLTSLESESASRRIEAVYHVQETVNPDNVIIEAIIDRMIADENINVRLSAVEALSNYTKNKLVRDAMIKSLASEKNPNIQIAIIQSLVKINEKRALKPMQVLMENDSTLPFVKSQIESLIPVIS